MVARVIVAFALVGLASASEAHAPAPSPAPPASDSSSGIVASMTSADDGNPSQITPASMGSIVSNAIAQQLANGNQLIVSLVVFVFGFAFCFYGEKSFEILVCASVGFFAWIICKQEYEEAYPEWNAYFHSYIAALGAGLGFFLAYKSKESIMLLVGTFAGYYSFSQLQGFLEVNLNDAAIADSPWFVGILMPLSIGLGLKIFVYSRIWKKAIVLVSAFAGSVLITSSITFYVAEILINTQGFQSSAVCGSEDCQWLGFFHLISSQQAATVGVLENGPGDVIATANEDRLAARGICALVFLIGFLIQWKRVKREEQREAELKNQEGATGVKGHVKGREPSDLTARLLVV